MPWMAGGRQVGRPRAQVGRDIRQQLRLHELMTTNIVIINYSTTEPCTELATCLLTIDFCRVAKVAVEDLGDQSSMVTVEDMYDQSAMVYC